MVKELLHSFKFCCFECNRLFAIFCMKGCSKHVLSVVAAAKYCNLTPCRFRSLKPPSPSTRERKISPKFSCIKFSETPSGHGRPCIWVKDVRAKKLYVPALGAMGRKHSGRDVRPDVRGTSRQKTLCLSFLSLPETRVPERYLKITRVSSCACPISTCAFSPI